MELRNNVINQNKNINTNKSSSKIASALFYRSNSLNRIRNEMKKDQLKSRSPFLCIHQNEQNLKTLKNEIIFLGKKNIEKIELEIANEIINVFLNEKNHLYNTRNQYLSQKSYNMRKERLIREENEQKSFLKENRIKEQKNIKKKVKLILEKEKKITKSEERFGKTCFFEKISKNMSCIGNLRKIKQRFNNFKEVYKNRENMDREKNFIFTTNKHKLNLSKKKIKSKSEEKLKKEYSCGPLYLRYEKNQISQHERLKAVVKLQSFIRMYFCRKNYIEMLKKNSLFY